MKFNVLCATVIFTLGVLLSNGVSANGTDSASEITQQKICISKGTVIQIQADDAISSQSHQLNNKVNFTVVEDIKVDDIIIVPSGTKVEGIVTKSKRSAVWDKDGHLEVTFSEIHNIADTVIPVTGKLSIQGEKQNILVKYSMMGVLFKGKKALIEKGTKMEVQVSENTYIDRLLW